MHLVFPSPVSLKPIKEELSATTIRYTEAPLTDDQSKLCEEDDTPEALFGGEYKLGRLAAYIFVLMMKVTQNDKQKPQNDLLSLIGFP